MDPKSIALQKELFREESTGIYIKRQLEKMENDIGGGQVDYALGDTEILMGAFMPVIPLLGAIAIARAPVMVKRGSDQVLSQRRFEPQESAYLHFRLPYDGEQKVFFLKPTNFYGSFPVAHVDEGFVNFYLRHGSGRDAQREFTEGHGLLVDYLIKVKDDFSNAESKFQQRASAAAERRSDSMKRRR